MPSLFLIGGYRVFFWSNEGDEPVHVHVCKGNPTQNATKLWITSRGGCVLAHNKSHIPLRELNELMECIAAQSDYICAEWMRFYRIDELRFFC